MDDSLDLLGRTRRGSEDQSSRRIIVGAKGELATAVRHIGAESPKSRGFCEGVCDRAMCALGIVEILL